MFHQSKKLMASLIAFTVFAGLLSCYETDDFVQIIRIFPDNTAIVTHMGANVVYKNDAGELLSGTAVLQQAQKDCEKLRTKPEGGDRYVDCGTGNLPELFGSVIKRAQTPEGIDGHFTLLKPDADKYFDDLAERKDNKPVRKKFTLTPASLEIELQMPPGPIFDAKKSCVLMIQSPWPIVKTNADVVFSAYNTAAWNCSRKDTHPSILITLESRKD